MKDSTIRKLLNRLNKKISQLTDELKALQDSCPHPDEVLRKMPKCGGEFDNEYYYLFRCTDCDKRWSEEAVFENRYRGTPIKQWEAYP